MCNEEGFQITGNVFKKKKNGCFSRSISKNWSWRPYFLANILQMRISGKGFFSDIYSDLETGERIRTFSYPLEGDMYLFIDLPYAYLYEQDGLI